MSLFPLPQIAPAQAGLFDNIRNTLADPAVKAGLLQASMSMLNPNPNSSPFAQIFTGLNQGLQANQRYKDLETQRQVEKNNLLAEQEREDRKFGLQMGLNAARMKQIENSIATSQENSKSLGSLRAAQTERARRAPAAGRTGTPLTRDSFVRERMKTLLPGDVITPEIRQQWDNEYAELTRGSAGVPMPTPGNDPAAALQALIADGYSLEDAQALIDGVMDTDE